MPPRNTKTPKLPLDVNTPHEVSEKPPDNAHISHAAIEAALKDEAPLCVNCPYWRRLNGDAKHTNIGSCLRTPPSVQSTELTLAGPIHKFRISLSSDLCGEHPRFSTAVLHNSSSN